MCTFPFQHWDPVWIKPVWTLCMTNVHLSQTLSFSKQNTYSWLLPLRKLCKSRTHRRENLQTYESPFAVLRNAMLTSPVPKEVTEPMLIALSSSLPYKFFLCGHYFPGLSLLLSWPFLSFIWWPAINIHCNITGLLIPSVLYWESLSCQQDPWAWYSIPIYILGQHILNQLFLI